MGSENYDKSRVEWMLTKSPKRRERKGERERFAKATTRSEWYREDESLVVEA